MSNLGCRNHTLGNTTRYILDYSNWLLQDETLVTGTVTCPSPDVVVSAVKTNPDSTISFLVSGGAINEVFTLAIQATNSRGEVKNDTASFLVVSP